MDRRESGVRTSFQLHQAIRHWAKCGRGTASRALRRSNEDDEITKHGARAEALEKQIRDDSMWAQVLLESERERHAELREILAQHSRELAREIASVRADEAQHCIDEARTLKARCGRITEELVTRQRQLTFVQSDLAALKISRDRLAHQLKVAQSQVLAESKSREGSNVCHISHPLFGRKH